MEEFSIIKALFTEFSIMLPTTGRGPIHKPHNCIISAFVCVCVCVCVCIISAFVCVCVCLAWVRDSFFFGGRK